MRLWIYLIMSETVQKSRVSGVKIAIAAIPGLLIVAVIVALWLGVRNSGEEVRPPMQGEVTVEEMVDYLVKVENLVGERSIRTEEGRKGMKAVGAMTESLLGPLNLGYQVESSQLDSEGGLLWKTLTVTAGNEELEEVVVVAMPLAGSASALVFGYGFAEYLTSHRPEVGVRMVFYPPLESGSFGSWIWERSKKEGEVLKGVVRVLGGGPEGHFAAVDGVSEGLLEILKRKEWDGKVQVGEREGGVVEVRVLDDRGVSRERRAGRLMRVMPLVKDFVERLGQ